MEDLKAGDRARVVNSLHPEPYVIRVYGPPDKLLAEWRVHSRFCEVVLRDSYEEEEWIP